MFGNKSKETRKCAEEKTFSDETKKKIGVLEERIRQYTPHFYHSAPLMRIPISSENNNQDIVEMDIRDIFLAAAIAKTNVLVVGESGNGKTEMALSLAKALFGEDGTSNLVITPDLAMSKLVDMDFSPLLRGGSLSDTQKCGRLITTPATVFDELNRAPPQAISILQSYLDGNRRINLEGGASIVPGKPIGDKYYKWIVGTANPQRDGYVGTFETDKAISDRFPITIPWDMFPQTSNDEFNMMLNNRFSDSRNAPKDGLFEEVKDLYMTINSDGIEVSALATSVVWYFAHKDHCYRALGSGKKTEIHGFTPGRTCKGCKASAANSEICGNVGGISNRALLHMIPFSKAIAAIKAYKADSPVIKVGPEDVKAVAPFILYGGKMRIEEGWIENYASGPEQNAPSLWRAIEKAVEIMSNTALLDTVVLSKNPDRDTHLKILESSPASCQIEDVVKYARELENLRR